MRSVFVLILVALLGGGGLFPPANPLLAQDDPARDRSSRTRSLPTEPEGAIQAAEGSEPAKVAAGRIPVLDLLTFIERTSGKLVIVPSVMNDPHFGPEITVMFLGDQETFDVTTARAYLEWNGYVLTDGSLPNGKEVVYVTARTSRTLTALPEPSIVIGPGEPIPDGTHERARMVIQFSKVDSASISMTLRAVFGIAGPSVTGKSVVEVGGTNQIVVTASLRDLRSVRALAEHLDTVSPIPKKPRKTTPSD